jgi:hypothetical protein
MCRASNNVNGILRFQSKIPSIRHTSIFYSYGQEWHGQTFKCVNSGDFCDAFRVFSIPDKYATDKLWSVSIIRKRHSGTQELLMRWGRVLLPRTPLKN